MEIIACSFNRVALTGRTAGEIGHFPIAIRRAKLRC